MLVATQPIALRYESSFGTPTGTRKYLRVRGFNVHSNENVRLLPNLFSKKGSTVKKLVKKEVFGDVSLYVNPQEFGYWLKLGLGEVSSGVAPTESIVYRHIFNQSSNLPSFSAERSDGVKNILTSGLKVDNFRVSGANDIIESMISVVGKDYEDGGTYTPSLNDALDPFTFDQAFIRFGNDLDEALLADHTPMDSWSLEYFNNLRQISNVNRRDLVEIKSSRTEIRGTLQTISETDDLQMNYMDGVEKALVIDLIGSEIGNNSNYRIQFRLPRITFTSSQKPYDSNNLIVETLNYEAMLDETEEFSLQIYMYNLLNNYV